LFFGQQAKLALHERKRAIQSSAAHARRRASDQVIDAARVHLGA